MPCSIPPPRASDAVADDEYLLPVLAIRREKCECDSVELAGGPMGALRLLSAKRFALAQAVLFVSAVAYMSLIVYHSVASSATRQQGPQGLPELASNVLDPDPVTVPPQPPPPPVAPNSVLAGGAGGGVSGPGVMTAATATSKPPTTSLQDIFVSVKTTRFYHRWRLPVILKTWFQLAKDQTWFFTDTEDPEYQKKTNGHMINTNCSSTHNRRALCCKMSVELDVFLDSDKKWFCHFDDDNYVNIPQLVRVLGDYSPQQDWYLGKPSIRAPLEIISKENKSQRISFWFATGGAGFCLSRALALKMMPVAGGGKFISIGEKIRLPDDVTMGYIIEHLLRKPLTVVDQFHSHLEPMKFLRQDTMHEQITFSYSRYSKHEVNVLKIDGFDTRVDPTRFLSLHCFLFSYFSFCPR